MGAKSAPLTTAIPARRSGFAPALAALCWFVAGLALSRLLFESLFPAAGFLGRPLPAVGLGALAAALGAALVFGRRSRAGETSAPLALAFCPLLLNLVWLVDPAVGPARGRFLFGASGWLVAVLLARLALGDADRRWRRLGPLFVIAALLPVYLATLSHAVGAADTFEFQVVAPRLGIAHPTGYPLYLLLGKLFSLLPAGTVAWRLNLASAVYAALAVAVVFRLALELLRRPLPALAGAVILGFVPIFWSQAIIAEVYTLHALIVAGALGLMLRLTTDHRPLTTDDGPQTADRRPPAIDQRPTTDDRKTMVALAFVLGLGLTNHLTTVFLLPPAALAIALNLWPHWAGGRRSAVSRRRSAALLLLQLSVAFAVPLLLYLYLPLRWAAINGEPMGFGRFVEWVAGGRFQGALQWAAWLRDPTRWQIVGRLLLDAWDWFYLALATVGLVWLLIRHWRAALVLLLAALGFTFYALNYYVPDLAVFLIPTHVVIAVWVAAGLVALFELLETGFFRVNSRLPNSVSKMAMPLLFLLTMIPSLTAVGGRWSAVDQSPHDGGEPWGRGVLALPLARGAVVLADSEKIAPLYYLQQIERLRPDLDIMVLPDEAAYRAELDARLAAGQAVYLARYLPGLAGVYHLRSVGPLVEVSREPLVELPAGVTPSGQSFGPLRLLGYRPEPDLAGDPAITLFWALAEPLANGAETPTLYTRWSSAAYSIQTTIAGGRHPVGDSYPVNAWRPGEIVADYHLLPPPIAPCAGLACPIDLQVAVAPRFTPGDELAWQTVAAIPVVPPAGPVGSPRRALLDGFALDGLDFPPTIRLDAPLPLRYSGQGAAEPSFLFVPRRAVDSLVIPAAGRPAQPGAPRASRVFSAAADPAVEAGPHVLIAYPAGELTAVCGWLARPTTGCVVAEIEVSGAPLPAGAVNFDDRIALLDLAADAQAFVPGGQLPVTITWQGLSPMSENYTVFVQVLDAADRIVGQVDAWPVQGTRPTSAWRPGEVVTDPYVVQLSPDLPPGDYRVIAGLYLLATGQRLPVLDEAGNPIDDKVEVGISGR